MIIIFFRAYRNFPRSSDRQGAVVPISGIARRSVDISSNKY